MPRTTAPRIRPTGDRSRTLGTARRLVAARTSPRAPMPSTSSRSSRSPSQLLAGYGRGARIWAPARGRSRVSSPSAAVAQVVGDRSATWAQMALKPLLALVVPAYLTRRGRRAALRGGRCVRRCRSPCLVFEHIDPTRTGERWPRSRGCCGPVGRFALFLNHPLLQTPGQRLGR